MVIIFGQIRFLEERIENKILLPNVFSYLKKIINLIINQNIKFILMGEIVFVNKSITSIKYDYW